MIRKIRILPVIQRLTLFLDLEENQDKVENNENNEQEEDKDSNNSSDDFIDMTNPDPDKGIIEEEFDDTHYRLWEIVIRDYNEEYTFDLNVHWCIAKDASDRSMGIRAKKKNRIWLYLQLQKKLYINMRG